METVDRFKIPIWINEVNVIEYGIQNLVVCFYSTRHLALTTDSSSKVPYVIRLSIYNLKTNEKNPNSATRINHPF